jgi:chromosome segregation ATPase
MTDADIVREALDGWRAVAALDRLVAERDEARREAMEAQQLLGSFRPALEAAEAERDMAREEWYAYREQQRSTDSRWQAAEAEVQRLRAFVTEFQAQHFSAYDTGGVAWEWQDKARAALAPKTDSN